MGSGRADRRACRACCGMTADELDGVATFYPFIFRKPVGRHVSCVCDGVSCWVMGYEAVTEALTRQLGVPGAGPQRRPVYAVARLCIGACDRAPAMMVDGERVRRLPGRQRRAWTRYLRRYRRDRHKGGRSMYRKAAHRHHEAVTDRP